tara:strand:- start:264 stop:1112 length:849 start_codon:yes stop_codon:yes gene_type:complete
MNFIKITKKKFMSIDFLKHGRGKSVTNQLSRLLSLLYTNNLTSESLFTNKKSPYIIGINGSVASGKSFFSNDLLRSLKCLNPKLKIGLLSTDNFIYSNKILKKKKLFHKKGFTESYDWKLLFKILKNIKTNKSVTYPYYSQTISDIHPRRKLRLSSDLDILIIEGINLLKPTCNITPSENLCRRFLLSDYIDYSVYIEISEKNLKKIFHKRMVAKKTLWKKKKIKKTLTRKNKKEFKKMSNEIWNIYNSPNLEQNINPFRYRSNLIIHKDNLHKVDFLEFKI